VRGDRGQIGGRDRAQARIFEDDDAAVEDEAAAECIRVGEQRQQD
jgi:hypothetical protein